MEQATCCKDAKSLTAGNSPACWEYVDDGWAVPGCCGGGCYILQEVKYCPFCGKGLPGTCCLNQERRFHSEEILKACSYGCYWPDSTIFEHATVDGVKGSYVHESVCPVHGVVFSPLGGIYDSKRPAHPCGAYKK